MAKTYDKIFKDMIIKERLSGLSIRSISIKHGISVSVIHKWLKHKQAIPPKQKTLINGTEIIKNQKEISFKLNGHLISVGISDLSRLLQALKS